MQNEKGSSSKMIEPRSYAETVKGSIKKEEYKKKQEEDNRGTTPPRRFKVQQPTIEISHAEEGFRRETPFRRASSPRYHTIFLGLCYSCNNFGHKVVNCRAYDKNRDGYESHSRMSDIKKAS
jgi:hypothetical protein